MKRKRKALLSIVIPCFNEKDSIVKLLGMVMSANTLGLDKEIIVVDDGSIDGTRSILKRYAESCKIIFHDKNIGKGGALKTGIRKSKGDIILIQDADLEYDPGEYPLLLEPIINKKADVVYGSRFMGGRPHRVVYYWHSVMNHLLTTFSNMLTNINLSDMETCYKVVDGEVLRRVAPHLRSDRFGFEPELTARLAKIRGLRFYEVGISYYGRTYDEGKKITWKDGLKAIYQIFYYNVIAK